MAGSRKGGTGARFLELLDPPLCTDEEDEMGSSSADEPPYAIEFDLALLEPPEPALLGDMNCTAFPPPGGEMGVNGCLFASWP